VLFLALSVVLFGSPESAFASDQWSTAPDPNGNYAHCNFRISRSTTASTPNHVIACQYGPTAGQITTYSVTVTWSSLTGGTGCFATPPTSGGAITQSGATIDTNEGGLYAAHKLQGADCGATFGGLAVTACTVTITNYGFSNLTNVPCAVDSIVSGGTSSPGYPTKFYPGGQSGGTAPVACFTYTPTTFPSAPVDVAVDASCSTNKTGASYAWNYHSGGTGTDTTGLRSTRHYGSNGTFTITLTMTAADSTTSTFSLTLVIPTPDTGADNPDCPTGWGVLNPASFGSLLSCLFSPTDIGSSFSTVSTTASAHYPVGPISWAAGFFTDTYTGLLDGIKDGTDAGTCDYTVTLPLFSGSTIKLPVIPGAGSDSSCTTSGQLTTYNGLSNIVHPASTVAIYVAGVLAVWRIAGGLFGGGDEGGADGD